MLVERSGNVGFPFLVVIQNMTIKCRFSMLRSESEPLLLPFYMVQMFHQAQDSTQNS